MARLVALMDSMRPTVRRVTLTLATAARTNRKTTAKMSAARICRGELVEIVDVASDQQMEAVWQGAPAAAEQRSVARRLRVQGVGAELDPSGRLDFAGRPLLQSAGDRLEGAVGEQIKRAAQTRLAGALGDRPDQALAAGGVIDLAQVLLFRCDRAVGATEHEGRGRPIDIAEQRQHHSAEHGDADQRQAEGGRAQRLSEETGHKNPLRGPYE